MHRSAPLGAVIGHVQSVVPAGLTGRAVGLRGRRIEADNRAVRVDPKDRLEIELAGVVADAQRGSET